MKLHYDIIPSPVGELSLVTAPSGAVRFVGFGTDTTWISRNGNELTRDSSAVAELRSQLQEYFAGERQRFNLVLQPKGTAFQLEVWRHLESIPYGETRSYGEVARAIGKPDSVRAVGTANGANPIAIIIPCHRVIGTNGSLVGYGGGLEKKKLLLELESVGTPSLFGAELS